MAIWLHLSGLTVHLKICKPFLFLTDLVFGLQAFLTAKNMNKISVSIN